MSCAGTPSRTGRSSPSRRARQSVAICVSIQYTHPIASTAYDAVQPMNTLA